MLAELFCIIFVGRIEREILLPLSHRRQIDLIVQHVQCCTKASDSLAEMFVYKAELLRIRAYSGFKFLEYTFYKTI